MSARKISSVLSKMHHVSQHPVVVSLDLHDRSTYMVCVDTDTGEIMRDCRVMGHYRKVLGHLKRLGARRRICVLIEAGPHGFAPWRCYTNAGYRTMMIASGSIPTPGNRQKTDRDDAMDNLHYHCSGLLRYVQVPTVADERMRECLRERQQAVWACTKEKQRLLSLLKRQGVEYNQTVTNWTKTHYRWLRSVDLPSEIRALLDLRLHRIQRFAEEETLLWQILDNYLEQRSDYSRLRSMYMRLAGIGPVTSATLILEGGDFSRFPHPKPFMKFVGLIPGKRQSGSSDPALHITKAGNKYLRTALVSIAKFYQDTRHLHSAKSIKDAPDALREFIGRCQCRLNSRCRALRSKGKCSTKARVAIARELAGFLWEYTTIVLPQLEQTTHLKVA